MGQNRSGWSTWSQKVILTTDKMVTILNFSNTNFQRLEEIGRLLKIITGNKARGRKVGDKLNLNDIKQLGQAIQESLGEFIEKI